MNQLTHPPDYWIGVDLGQKQNYTAIAVLERTRYITADRDPVSFAFRTGVRQVLRDIWRIPLGTEYPDVVAAIKRVVSSFEHRRLIVDATGVGAPVVDLLKRTNLGCPMDAVTITSGEQSKSDGHGRWHVPKRDLLTALQLMFEQGQLQIASSARDREALIEELANFQYPGVNHRHDDLVLATSLAAWRLTKRI